MSKVIDYYSRFDEWGRLDREPIEFLVNWHFIKNYLPPSGTILDNGAGPGKYSLRLARDGYNVTLTDLTPKLVDLAKRKAQELNVIKQFEGFYTCDARKLLHLENDAFDGALMLGPMYHLQEESDRVKAIRELFRVTKKDGVVFVAFMSRIKHMMNSLSNPENWKPHNNIDSICHFLKTGCFDHSDHGRFTGAYYFDIDEIKEFMEANGFETIQLVGSNIASILSNDSWDYWKEKDEAEMNKLMKLLIDMADDPYALGMSSHLLYIGRKI